jgi:uncharacterized membrane protein
MMISCYPLRSVVFLFISFCGFFGLFFGLFLGLFFGLFLGLFFGLFLVYISLIFFVIRSLHIIHKKNNTSEGKDGTSRKIRYRAHIARQSEIRKSVRFLLSVRFLHSVYIQ